MNAVFYQYIALGCVYCVVMQVVIMKLKMDKDRKSILERKAKSRTSGDTGKHTEETVSSMETSS